MSEIVRYVLIALFVVVLFVGFLIWRRAWRRRRRGKQGESEVAHILGGNVKGKQYVLNNLLFEREGQSCQIDHVLINEGGIWVIETKNLSGVIRGDEASHDWEQILRGGELRHTFYNPVKQNSKHIIQLQKALKAGDVFQNVVVFLHNADIRNVSAKEVCSVSELKTVLSRRTNVSLSSSERKGYYQKLKKLKRGSKISERQHVRNIKAKKKLIKKGICPRCGGKLLRREGKEGSYLECSAFPKCKFNTK